MAATTILVSISTILCIVAGIRLTPGRIPRRPPMLRRSPRSALLDVASADTTALVCKKPLRLL